MSEMKKTCELCSNPARMFCDSDQASLCWDCDEKVHAANFLVAKHSRTLLCHVCQSPTPWNAAGPNLGRTVTVCHACAHRGSASTSRRGNKDAYDSQESESDDGEYYTDESDDDLSDEEEEEDGENQVVPWSDSSSTSPAPPLTAASSSSSEESVSFSSAKRTREIASESEDDGGCSSPNLNSDENYSCSLSLLRPLKMRRRSSDRAVIPSEEEEEAAVEQGRRFSGTAAIVEKLGRIEREEGDASTMILRLCKLTGD